MNIFDYCQISPSRLKILAGIKWTNFWSSKVEDRENKGYKKTALFAVPNLCKIKRETKYCVIRYP